MFDNLIYNGKTFQTKDFDCEMTTYYIEADRILKSVGHTEDRSKATAWQKEHPEKPLPAELEGFMGLLGCLSWVEIGKEDLNWHGWVNFYGDDDGEWEEYNAKFTDGAMVEIKRVPNKP